MGECSRARERERKEKNEYYIVYEKRVFRALLIRLVWLIYTLLYICVLFCAYNTLRFTQFLCVCLCIFFFVFAVAHLKNPSHISFTLFFHLQIGRDHIFHTHTHTFMQKKLRKNKAKKKRQWKTEMIESIKLFSSIRYWLWDSISLCVLVLLHFFYQYCVGFCTFALKIDFHSKCLAHFTQHRREICFAK